MSPDHKTFLAFFDDFLRGSGTYPIMGACSAFIKSYIFIQRD
jgi:hypothetical protein